MSSRTRLLALAAVLVLAVIGVAYLAMRMTMEPPAGLDLSRAKSTAKGLYAVSIEPEAGKLVQNEMHSWVLTVKTPTDQPVTGATVAIDGGMPQHGHGLPTSPQAAEIGEGRYRIEGVRFNMSGWWELTFSISGAQGEDDVVFNLTL